MSKIVLCPKCGTPLRADANSMGKVRKCSHCGAALRVPAEQSCRQSAKQKKDDTGKKATKRKTND